MKKTYYLFNPGILSRKDNTLKFTPVDKEGHELQPRYIPVEGVGQFYVFGSLQANSSLFNFMGKNDIPVHFFDYYDNYTGSYMPRDHLLSGKVLISQVKKHMNRKERLKIAVKLLDGASFNIIKNLRYYNNRGKDLDKYMDQIDSFREMIPAQMEIPDLMGVEGNIRQIYYASFGKIIDTFEFGGRTKQPPSNELNAMISFGNMMCYSECLRAIHQTQLNPTISYLHSPGERRYSLALDIAEIFKPVIVDRLIFRLANRKEIREKHFEKQMHKCLLNDSGRKVFVKAFEERLDETIQHRQLRRNVSYRHLIKLECYKISKHILDIEKYKPFRIYW